MDKIFKTIWKTTHDEDCAWKVANKAASNHIHSCHKCMNEPDICKKATRLAHQSHKCKCSCGVPPSRATWTILERIAPSIN